MKNPLNHAVYIDTAKPLPFQMRYARWIEGEGDDDATGDDDIDDDTTDGDDDDTDTDTGDELGDKGKQALDRMKAKWKAERARRIAAEAAAAEKDTGKNDDDTVDREKVEREAVAKANARIVRSEIKAAAAGKLADPKDALNFIDPDDFEVDDDGNVDEDEIADAIDDLLTRKPYLAAQGGPKKPKPDQSQGQTGTGTATTAQQFAAAVNKYI